MKKIIILIIILSAAGYWFVVRDSGTETGENMQLDPKEVLVAGSAVLHPVDDHTGSGKATRQWDGTRFVHTVQTDLPPPPEGKFYEGWLVRPEPFEFISTGRLEAQESGFGLQFSMERDLTEHVDVVITLETEANGLDGVPEEHILEGSF